MKKQQFRNWFGKWKRNLIKQFRGAYYVQGNNWTWLKLICYNLWFICGTGYLIHKARGQQTFGVDSKGLSNCQLQFYWDATWIARTRDFALVFNCLRPSSIRYFQGSLSHFLQVFAEMSPFQWKLLWQPYLKVQCHSKLILSDLLLIFYSIITTWHSK